MSVSVQNELFDYIRERAEKGHFGSTSDYIRWLVHCDRRGKMQTETKESAKSRVRTMNESMLLSMFDEFLENYYASQ